MQYKSLKLRYETLVKGGPMPESSLREEILVRIENDAYDYEKNSHGCSRCLFKALQDNLNLEGGPSTLKASTPLAAGVAMQGETCGALLGGLLAIGIVTASEDFEDTDALTDSLAAGFRLVKKVQREFGTTNCVEIQTEQLGRSYRLTDPKEYEKFIQAKDYVKCPQIVGKIARMTAEFILDYQTKETKG